MRVGKAVTVCAVALAADAGLSITAAALMARREDRDQGKCDGSGLFHCSFEDLIPTLAVRAGALVLIALLVKALTREGGSGVAADGRNDLELGEPLLGESAREEPETEEDFKRAAAKDARFKAYKTIGAALVFSVSTASQVYLALKVGLFANKELLQEGPHDVVTPLLLTSIVIVVNLEAMAFARLVDSGWHPNQYICRKLHIHPLFYEPKHFAWR